MSNPPPSPPPPQPASAADMTTKLSTVRTYILIALIFSAIFLLVWFVGFIYGIIALAVLTTVGIGFLAIGPLIFYLIWFAVSILCFLRIWKMWKAVNANDVATLKATSNIMWAVISLIFNGVIPGIMLIISDGPIKQL